MARRPKKPAVPAWKQHYEAERKARPLTDPAFKDLTPADYAVMRAQLEEMTRMKPKGGRPRTTAAGVAEARIVAKPPRRCQQCGVEVGPRRWYCDTHSSEREREQKAAGQQRYREANRERYRAHQKAYRQRRRERERAAAQSQAPSRTQKQRRAA